MRDMIMDGGMMWGMALFLAPCAIARASIASQLGDPAEMEIRLERRNTIKQRAKVRG